MTRYLPLLEQLDAWHAAAERSHPGAVHCRPGRGPNRRTRAPRSVIKHLFSLLAGDHQFLAMRGSGLGGAPRQPLDAPIRRDARGVLGRRWGVASGRSSTYLATPTQHQHGKQAQPKKRHDRRLWRCRYSQEDSKVRRIWTHIIRVVVVMNRHEQPLRPWWDISRHPDRRNEEVLREIGRALGRIEIGRRVAERDWWRRQSPRDSKLVARGKEHIRGTEDRTEYSRVLWAAWSRDLVETAG